MVGVDRPGVARLFQSALLDDIGRALARLEHDLKDLLGNGSGNRAVCDKTQKLGSLRGRNGTFLDALGTPVERSEQLRNHPVSTLFRVDTCIEQCIEPPRRFHFGGQDAGVVGRYPKILISLPLGVGKLRE